MTYSIAAHLRGPVHFILFIWLLLLTVSLHWWFDWRLSCPALATDRRSSTGNAEGVGGFPLSDATSLRSVVSQHFGKILAAVQLLHYAGAGKTVGGQNVDGPGRNTAIGLSSDQGGRSRVFKELPFSAPIQFLEVLV